ncbi:MAG: PAS domain S-box protein, partial [Candidatus Aenigmatarchaeota archaeon]
MRLKFKFSIITFIVVIFLSLSIEAVAIFIFYKSHHTLIKKLFEEKLQKIILLANEQDELFFEGLYKDELDAQNRFLDKIRIDYRKQKKAIEFFFIIKTDGTLVIHPNLPSGNKILNQEIVDFINKEKEGQITYTYNGVKYWAVFKNFKNWNWNFLITIPIKEKNKNFINFVFISGAITFLIIGISILFILNLIGKYVNIISLLNKKINKISSGQYSFDYQTEKNLFGSNDEISELAQNIINMAENLKNTTVSRNYFESIIKGMSDILIVIDENKRIKTINQATIDILKYSGDEIVGKDIGFLFSNNELILDKLLKNAKEKGFVENYDLTISTKHGEKLDVFLTLTSIYLDKKLAKSYNSFKEEDKDLKKISGFIFLIKDVTKYKQIQKELEKQKERTQLYFDIVGTMLLVLDRNANVLLANKKTCQVLEVTQEEIIGKNWLENFLPAEEKEKIKEVFYKIINGDTSFEYLENNILTKTSKKRLIAWHNTVIKDEYGKIVGTLSSGEDITEKRKLEERIIKLNNYFLNLGSDSKKNITNLVKLCQEVFEADGVFYNHIEADKIYIKVATNPLFDLKSHDLKSGHICDFVIKNVNSEPIVLRNLEKSDFAKEDPHILQYNFKTYIGQVIKINNENKGILCMGYTNDFEPSKEDLKFFGIIAKAIEVEEDRHQAQEKLNNALKEALKSREIMLSMLEDNNIIRENLEKKLEELKAT